MTPNVYLVLVRTTAQPRQVELADGCCSCTAARPLMAVK
jgi:hypothetical protein